MTETAASPLLELKGVVKQFLAVTALDKVDFDLRPGEVHALMGENGAGKSTLIKVMTGVYKADQGSIQVSGSVIHPQSPDDAVRHGISTVYQEVNLAPNLSVMENICLGREPMGVFGINWKKLKERAERAVDRLGLKVDVRRQLGSCSIAVQQLVAIARALDVDAKVLVLDEPTSSLDAGEVEQLFGVVRRLKSEGMGIVFVTHFLDQVYELSDRITILRNGQKVGVYEAATLPKIELVSLMIGRDASKLDEGVARGQTTAEGAPFVLAEGLERKGAVSGVNFSISPGEVLGFAGLLGSGRTETIRMIFGVDSPDHGKLSIDASPSRGWSPRRAIRSGFGLCPEDRKVEGIFPDLSIRENMLIVMQAQRGWLRRISTAEQKRIANELAASLKLQPPDVERPIQFLSGGNQQKALLARWIAVKPRLLLLDEPTRGIDVGAKFEIMSLVESLRSKGSSFVFVSSELSEVVRTSTKVLVMRDRKAVRELHGDAITEEAIVGQIAGGAN